MKVWAWISVACAIILILLGLEADWRPYTLLGCWAVFGLIYYALRSHAIARAALEVSA
jgi:APA family basic amino acid/polyamine antiporter